MTGHHVVIRAVNDGVGSRGTVTVDGHELDVLAVEFTGDANTEPFVRITLVTDHVDLDIEGCTVETNPAASS